MEKIDLGWGHPEFLQEYWKAFKDYNIQCGTDNNYIFGIIPELKQSIIQLHKEHNNADVDGKYIVVGNGASQIINGLINVLRPTSVYANAPHYTKFPRFAETQKTQWLQTPDALEICTIPNNPDATVPTILNGSSIYDLSYNWQQYTNSEPINLNMSIMVYSLSKATGHASTRVGWAILKDEALAKKLEQFIEYSCNNVSIHSQKYASYVINTQVNTTWYPTVFEFGKNILQNRWKELETLQLPFEVLNNQGMFIWCKGKQPSEYITVSGTSVGVTDEYFRINLGCSEEKWKLFKEMYERQS